MNPELARTPLHDWHQSHQGRMVEFGGWSMPVQYQSIMEEHQAVRTAVGLFDVSHMGRFAFTGSQAWTFLDHVLTRRVLDLPAGRVRYSLVTSTTGGILDDVLVYHVVGEQGNAWPLLVVNASNRAKLWAWFSALGAESAAIGIRDNTLSTAMIAVQGPQAIELVGRVAAVDMRVQERPAAGATGSETSGATAASSLLDQLRAIPAYGVRAGRWGEWPLLVSRTGYTGEDGLELIVPAAVAVLIWQRLVDGGGRPVGLGARDTLRLEAAMPLYGHELSENRDPFAADLSFAVQLEGRHFVGSEALLERRRKPARDVRVGVLLEGKRVAREGYGVLVGGERVGEVTSGTFSPTLQQSLAMAYVRRDYAVVGQSLQVDIRGQLVAATVVKLPFYRRS
jgi:aminomethyltransferase